MLGAREYNKYTVPTFRECSVWGRDIKQSHECISTFEMCCEEKVNGMKNNYNMGPDLGWG